MRDFSDLENVREMAQSFADEEQEPVVICAFGRDTARHGQYDFMRESTYRRSYSDQYAEIETLQPRYRRLDDIKRRNMRVGNYWFEPDTMRFFSSRVHSTIYIPNDGAGVAYFVTSEKPPHARRAYSVRRANVDGSIDTVGEFCGYRTGRQAHAEAARIAEQGESTDANVTNGQEV